MLNKAHFIECYEQTANVEKGLVAYKKAIVLILLSIVAAYLAEQYPTVSLFIFGLGVVEALSVYFAKTWWVWRQLLSKAANNKVDITIDEKGIATQSIHHKLELSWAEITDIIETSCGIILQHSKGRNYLSFTCISPQAHQFIKQQANR